MLELTLNRVANCFFVAYFVFMSAFAFSQEFNWKLESKIHIRDSADNFIATAFPPDSGHQTVDAGTHAEISNVSLSANYDWGDWKLSAKIDAVDLYEKNPTSSDYKISVDRIILRYGNWISSKSLALKDSYYVQIGKFTKFEMQLDRHLESYGLVSTAFNRLEDAGLEVGVDFQNGWYGKVSYTAGNPVFFRDPNALAGDNGVEDPDFKPGFLILYDAEVENDLDFSETPELGLAMGYRWQTNNGRHRYNLMAFHYERDLATSIPLNGTFYGGDKDLFEFSELFFPGPVDPDNDLASIPLSSNSKTESGITLWHYRGASNLFAQYVRQDIGGLKRTGMEIEVSHSIRMPQDRFFKMLVPAARYSKLTNDFSTSPLYPSPSIGWDWEKLDIGVTGFINTSVSLTIEYAFNEFETKGGNKSNNEALATLHWRFN